MTLSFLNNQWFLNFFVLCFCFDQMSACLQNAYFIFSSFWKKTWFYWRLVATKESPWLMPWKFLAFLKTIWQRDFSMSKCLIEAAMTISFLNNQCFLKFFVLGFCFDQMSVCLQNAYFIFTSFWKKKLDFIVGQWQQKNVPGWCLKGSVPFGWKTIGRETLEWHNVCQFLTVNSYLSLFYYVCVRADQMSGSHLYVYLIFWPYLAKKTFLNVGQWQREESQHFCLCCFGWKPVRNVSFQSIINAKIVCSREMGEIETKRREKERGREQPIKRDKRSRSTRNGKRERERKRERGVG